MTCNDTFTIVRDSILTFVFVYILVKPISKKFGTRFIEFIFKLTNLPYYVNIFCKDKFAGLNVKLSIKGGFTEQQIKSLLYEVFCICKAQDLTVEGKTYILYKDSFKEKGSSNTVNFYSSIKTRGFKVVDNFFTHNTVTANHSRFLLMIKEFELFCNLYISPSEAYLLTMLSGSCFGAVYEAAFLNSIVRIACNITIDNNELADLTNYGRHLKLFGLCGYLFADEETAMNFKNLCTDYFELNNKNKEFDIYSFIVITLTRLLQEGELNDKSN